MTHLLDSSRIQRIRPLVALLFGALCLTVSANLHASIINEWEPLDTEATLPKPAIVIQPGQNWRDPMSEANLLWIAGGCYEMGSPPRAEGRESDEGPVHQECVNGYWLGETEVTQGQWRRVMHNNPSRFRKGESYPVENVTREEVNEFIAQLNSRARINVQFRLPTEAEWEFACRNAGQRIIYPGGSDPTRFGWFSANSNGTTQPVGLRPANQLGLKDMSGNVWEWVQDRYQSNYSKSAQALASNTAGAEFFTIRGGGWQDETHSLRCANRGFQSLNSRRPDLGVRLAASVKVKEKKSGSRPTDSKRIPF
ncbi:MAG: formylglycine-generating enzyme family protein [Magnetococcus sp. YQC-9]